MFVNPFSVTEKRFGMPENAHLKMLAELEKAQKATI